MKMDIEQIVKFATLAYLVCVGTWFATAQAKFSRDSKTRPMLFLMIGCSLLTTVATLILTVPVAIPQERIAATLVMTTMTVLLIKWAFRSINRKNLGLAFSGVVPSEVVQHGPYRYVRHPLYLAYSIFWASCAVISASLLVAACAAAVIITYILAARSEERDLMGSNLGSVYDAYRKRTGLILPRLLH
jgi:protein-S-isoprenylcysteine O-methyltransferase Ste14